MNLRKFLNGQFFGMALPEQWKHMSPRQLEGKMVCVTLRNGTIVQGALAAIKLEKSEVPLWLSVYSIMVQGVFQTMFLMAYDDVEQQWYGDADPDVEGIEMLGEFDEAS